MLACGAVLLTERMTGVRSAAISWHLPAGSATDTPALEGRAPLWSELLLRGTRRLTSQEHADAADRLGASRDTELGTFTMRVSSTMLGEHLPNVLPLLVDMVREPRMDDASVEASRELCLQAIESLKDDPQERASLLAHERHHAHPVSLTGMGTPKGLAANTPEQLRRDWSRYAVPTGSIFSVAGAIDANRIEDELNTLFDGWTGTAQPVRTGTPAQRGYAHTRDESSQVQVIVLADGPTETSPDSPLEKLAVTVLSGGMSGRLFSEVREKRGLCYSVHAGYRGDKDFGTLSAYVGTTPERAQESLDVLLGEIHRITTPAGRVTPEELDRARIGMKAGLVMSGESAGARAASMASDYRRTGRARTLAETAREVEAVSLDELNAYLAQRTLGKITVQTLGKEPLTVRA